MQSSESLPHGHVPSAAALPSATLTRFSSRTAPTGTRQRIDWPTWLASLLATPRAYALKTQVPGWSPATFAADRRGNDHVEHLSALVLDGDDGGSLDDTAHAFGAHYGLLHTSYSHGQTTSKDGQPCAPRTCWRLVLVLTRAVTAAEHAPLWAWAAAQAARHGLRLDPAPKAPGQFWYLPAVRPGAEASYRARLLLGTPLDPDAVLAPLVNGTEPPPPRPGPRHDARPSREALARRGQTLCARHPPSVAGQNGSVTLMKLCVGLRRGLELPEDDCVALVEAHYNPRCQPPWTRTEIAKKVRDADTNGRKPWGYLLRDGNETARGGGDEAARPVLRVVPPAATPPANDPDRERRQGPRRHGERRVVTPLDPWAFHTTDMGNGERLIARHGSDLRYCHPWQKWLVWDGRCWKVDDTAEVRRRANETARAIYAEAAAVAPHGGEDERAAKRRTELASWARKTEARERRDAMVFMAQEHHPVVPEQLDANAWLLNVANGTIDLRTGQLRPHRHEDLLTKVAPVSYDPQATCPTWLTFLDTILAGDAELLTFVQRFTGYALTGDTSEHVLLVAYGTGANGKSTFFDTLLALVGDYGWQAPPDILLQQQAGHHPADEASLFRVRLAVCAETPGNRRLDTAKMKRLTGGERVTARRMREDWWSFTPTHKLALGTNHKLLVDTTDHGTWRRPKMVPFAVTIPPEKRDKQLPKRLLAELPGILRWAVEGCLQWQRHGLGEPRAIREATQAWRDESDVLGAFLATCCELGSRYEATSKALYKTYLIYCEANGDEPLKQQPFGRRLTERGLETGKGTGGARVWRGLRLAVQAPTNDGPPGGRGGQSGGSGGSGG